MNTTTTPNAANAATNERPADARRYAETAEHGGIAMRLIGCWCDLAAYYLGADGFVWCWSACTHRWSNCGEAETFRARQAGEVRGITYRGVFWAMPAKMEAHP